MNSVRFAIYADAPFGLNYYSPKNNIANTANHLYQGNELKSEIDVTQAIDYATDMLAKAPFTDIIFSGFSIANATPSSPWYRSSDQPFITWNNIPFAPKTTPSGYSEPGQVWGLAPTLTASLEKLRESGSGKKLLASFANGTDLSFINDYSNHFGVAEFYEVFSELGFDGVDFDMEGSYFEYPQLLAQLSNQFGLNSKLVSHAPYGSGAFPCEYSEDMMAYYVCPVHDSPGTPIVGNTVITDPTDAGKEVNSVSWLNVQLYSGGNQGSVSNAIEYYNDAIFALNKILSSGISDSNYFMLAGFSPIICDPEYTL